MKPRSTPRRRALILTALLLAGCETAENLVFEPAINDPLDGYEGSLSQAGINTDMDWGPKQSHLLSEHQRLLKRESDLRTEHETALAENQNLLNQLDAARAELEREQGLRAQAEAEAERLRGKSREYEASILTLSIDKAKLEQELLLKQIESLEAPPVQEGPEAKAVPATAQPGRRP